MSSRRRLRCLQIYWIAAKFAQQRPPERVNRHSSRFPSLGKATPQRRILRRRVWRKSPAERLLKTVSGDLTEDAAAVVAGVAMGEARFVVTDVSGDQSRVLRGLPLKMFLLLWFPGRRNLAEPSSLDRRRDTSRYCFPENRFPNTGAWRPHRWCRGRVPKMRRLKRVLLLPPSHRLWRHWLRLSQMMNPSSPVRLHLSNRRRSSAMIHDTRESITPRRRRLRRPQLRWTGTANFGGRNWPARIPRLLTNDLWKKKRRWWRLNLKVRIGRSASRRPRFLLRQGRWKKRPSTRKKRIRSAMNNRPMRAMKSSKKRPERQVRLPKSGQP